MSIKTILLCYSAEPTQLRKATIWTYKLSNHDSNHEALDQNLKCLRPKIILPKSQTYYQSQRCMCPSPNRASLLLKQPGYCGKDDFRVMCELAMEHLCLPVSCPVVQFNNCQELQLESNILKKTLFECIMVYLYKIYTSWGSSGKQEKLNISISH